MFIKRLREFGATSDMAYAATLVSIGASIAIWLGQRGNDEAHAERFGIFVGLWAPTFAILGNALKTEEQTELLSAKKG